MNSPAVEALLQKRDEVVAEKTRVNEKFDQEISELETAIETLSGKKVWEMPRETRYDDESPDYIKQSFEET